MANPTSNFGWQMPTNTDLVKDLPADFEVFGQAVDTSLMDLKGGTTGQVLSKASNTDMDFTWVTSDDADAIQNTIVDAKGDLIAATAADTPARLASSGVNGDVLTVDTTTATGLKWSAPAASSPLTTKGDVYTYSTTNARLAVGNNGETLVADSSTSTGLRWSSQFLAGKNKLINGDFNIWQRGTSFTATGYTADRWLIDADTTSFSQSRQSFTAGTAPVAGYEGTYFMRTTRGTGGTYCNSQQRIEDVRTFANQTVTLSFWAKASASCTIEPYYIQNFGSGGSGAVSGSFGTTTTLTTSWVRYSYTVTIPSISGKTIGTSSYLNILVARITSGTNVDVDTWGVQLEAGSVATAFQTATGTLAGELAACQRYYYRQGGNAVYESMAIGNAVDTLNVYSPHFLPVQMRVAPTSVDYSTLGISDLATGVNSVTDVIIDSNSKQIVRTKCTTASTLTQYRAYHIVANNSTSGFIAFNAEL